MTPEARKEQLLTQEVGDELVVYDERTHAAHRLNAVAALVWSLCDGRRSVPDLGRLVETTLGDVKQGEDVAQVAVEQLGRAGLLVGPLGEPLTRRRMLVLAATIIPIVASLEVPVSAQCGTLPLPPCPVSCAEVAGTDGSYFGAATRVSADAGCPSSPTLNISVHIACDGGDMFLAVFDLGTVPDYLGRTTIYQCTLNPDGTFSGTLDAGFPGEGEVGCTIMGGTVTNGLFTRAAPNRITFRETIQYSGCCTGSVVYNHLITKAP